MLNRLIAIGAWACLVFVAFATLSPLYLRPELLAGGPYKASATAVERFGAYAVLGVLFHLAYRRNLTFVCIVVFSSAVSLELLQYLVPNRDARFLDVTEKLMGGLAGIVMGHIIQWGFWPQTATNQE
jgi:VanZ family protein